MSRPLLLLFALVGVATCDRAAGPRTPSPEEIAITQHLYGDYETEASATCNTFVIAQWEYNIDVSNPIKEEAAINASIVGAEFVKTQWETWFRDAAWETYEDPAVARQCKLLSVLGISALDPATLEEFNREVSYMTGVYSSGRICPYNNQQCDLATEGIRLEPDMEQIMAQSRDYDELEYVWTEWRAASGAKFRSNYSDYVRLSNEAAVLNGFSDMGAMWRAAYETPGLPTEVQRLWSQVQPLYLRLHAYVKNILQGIYPQIPAGPYIPAHVLGNMWAQDWTNIYSLLVPFPNATEVDITQNMIDQGYNVTHMFEVANEFYTSLGLPPMEMAYGPNAVIEQPPGRDIVCHASAWDFCDRQDFRIKMCTTVDEEDFETIHHELGHIQYYIQYKDQPITFRNGANPGFHEAVGDVISLSVQTPGHYQSIGLLTGYEETYENSINTLLRFALAKVAFLPFSVVIDSWRWDVFSGAVPESQWNQHWWDLRKQYQLLDAPNVRTESDFDPGAKYHVAADSQYINYFIAHILQFQMHRSLCIEAGQYDPLNPDLKPLHTCDIYRSTAAGTKLAAALSLGASLHWSEVLFQMTGETQLDGTALLEYFKPLYDFLPPAPAEAF